MWSSKEEKKKKNLKWATAHLSTGKAGRASWARTVGTRARGWALGTGALGRRRWGAGARERRRGRSERGAQQAGWGLLGAWARGHGKSAAGRLKRAGCAHGVQARGL